MIKSLETWLPGYLRSLIQRPRQVPRPLHLLVGFMDHYEPFTPDGNAPHADAVKRVEAWRRHFPDLARSVQDTAGRPLQWTFFYPQEEYETSLVQHLVDFTTAGLAEVEIHLHHADDTADNLRQNLNDFRDCLRTTHGLLGSHLDGNPGYAFIHGDWTLCNAHPEGLNCGVNGELPILQKSGCYCDMTMPAGPHPAQSRTLNSIYYAQDKPGMPRSHDHGQPVTVRASSPVAEPLPALGQLMLLQGPMGLNWKNRKAGLLPRIDYGDVSADCPATSQRLQLWRRQHIHVRGRPEWLFLKLHTHGCRDVNLDYLLSGAFQTFLRELTDSTDYCLHFVTAREMYNLAKAAEAGHAGDPHDYLDFAITPPPCRRSS